MLGPLATFYWCLKGRLRARRAPGEISHGIDARPVLQRLQRVRSDYLGAYHATHHEISWRRGALVSARHALGRFSYIASRECSLTEKDERELD